MNWKDVNVLVTGAGGFIGSHLVERLLSLGANVRSFVHYNALGKKGWLDTISEKDPYECFFGDIYDRDRVRSAVEGVDIIFHLAALIGIPYSYQAPLSYINTNIIGTLNILQAAKESDVERIIHTSTSEVYGTAQYVPINENHPLQGQSPYSASKIAADKLVESFVCSFNLPVTTIRPFNTYGPRQSTRAIIPTIITQCLHNDVVSLGNVTPTRDLNYVSNTVDGFISGAEKLSAIGETINIGSGKEISIHDLVLKIANKLDKKISIKCDDLRLRPICSEVERLLADNSKAKELLGWEPKISLEKGLDLTIQWYNDHQEFGKNREYSI
jgi:dTDP-glucose 4,6-dehydratase